MAQFMLSLATNPYDPFEQYDLWSWFDRHEGYDTAGLLARVVGPTDNLPPGLEEDAVEAAIDSIVENPNFGGLYQKVKRQGS